MLKTLSPEKVVTADPELDSQVEENVFVSNPVVELARSYYQQLLQEGATSLNVQQAKNTEAFWRTLWHRLKPEAYVSTRYTALLMIAAVQLLDSLQIAPINSKDRTLVEPQSLLQSLPGKRAQIHREQLKALQQKLAKSQTEFPWLELLHDSLAWAENDPQIQEYITRPTAPPPEHSENR